MHNATRCVQICLLISLKFSTEILYLELFSLIYHDTDYRSAVFSSCDIRVVKVKPKVLRELKDCLCVSGDFLEQRTHFVVVPFVWQIQ